MSTDPSGRPIENTSSDEDLPSWQDQLELTLCRLAKGRDASHDLGHFRRVWRLAEQIARKVGEPVDPLVLLASAYLHDVVIVEKNDPQRGHASKLAAEKARAILSDLGFPPARLDAVAHAIEAHSFSAGIPPVTIEAKIVQDADRIEALGALGIARLFYVAGRMGRELFDEKDPRAEHRVLDDQRFALDHYARKLRQLPERMNTIPGREIAQERARFVDRFVDELIAEITETYPV